IVPNTCSINVDLYAKTKYTMPPTPTPIVNMTAAAKRLVSYGKNNPKIDFITTIVKAIMPLNIMTKNVHYVVCLSEKIIDHLIHHKFKTTAVPTASAVPKIDPFPANC